MTLRREDGGSLTEIGKVFRESGNSLAEVDAVYREESGSLTQVYSASDPPEDLSVTWDGVGCDMDLDWTPDESNSQDIWRCQSCEDPSASGSNITTVNAGVSHYDDTDPSENDGNTYCYEIVTTQSSSNTDCATPGICTN